MGYVTLPTKPFEAIVKGGKARLRPVILTAITTVFGLIPLAVGLNIDFFGLFSEFNPCLYWWRCSLLRTVFGP